MSVTWVGRNPPKSMADGDTWLVAAVPEISVPNTPVEREIVRRRTPVEQVDNGHVMAGDRCTRCGLESVDHRLIEELECCGE